MPSWLITALAVLAAVGVIGAWVARVTDRQTKLLAKLWGADIRVGIAEHAEKCPAHGRALGASEDDSGEVKSTGFSPSGRVVFDGGRGGNGGG